MGRQINFWMTQEDEHDFVERLLKDDAVWTPYQLPYGENPVLREFEDWVPVDEGQRVVVIRRDDWKALRWEAIPNALTGPWTMVGVKSSPSFEWDACERSPGVIKRGRIYFKSDWLERGEMHIKPEEPTKWFDRLKSWLRRRGTKGKYKNEYLMPHANTEFEKSGLTLDSD